MPSLGEERSHSTPTNSLRTDLWKPVTATVVSGLVVLSLASILLSWLAMRIWPWQLVSAQTSLIDIIKLSLAFVGGVGGVTALVISYRKQQVAEGDEARSGRAEQRDVVQRLDDRFVSATKLLGDSAPSVRLAGVYALATLADEWVDKRQQCIDVLCGYLRMPVDPIDRGEQEVRRTVVRLIRDHLQSSSPRSWSGCDLDFTGATFDDCSFEGAVFEGGTVSFVGARFVGGTNRFGHVRFGGAHVRFYGAHFVGGETRFDYARFEGGRVSFRNSLFDAEVRFPHLLIRSAELDFERSVFRSGEVRFDHSDLASGKLSFAGDATLLDGGRLVFADMTVSGTVSFSHASLRSGSLDFDRLKLLRGGQLNLTGCGDRVGAGIDLRTVEVSEGGLLELSDV